MSRLSVALLVPGLAAVLAGLESFGKTAIDTNCGETIQSGQTLKGFHAEFQDQTLLSERESLCALLAPEIEDGPARTLTAAVPMKRRKAGSPTMFLGVGDGIYNTADSRWIAFAGRKEYTGGLELQRLPGAFAAMENCARAAQPSRVLLLRGRDCCRSRLEEALLAHPDIIYIGTHIVSYRGERAIELGIDGAGRRELLTSADIRQLRVPGAIVAMDGCGSAAGPDGSGGELMSAWLAAGARAVIGTRSSIPDSRGEVSAALYRDLGRNSGAGAVARAWRNRAMDVSISGLGPGYSAKYVAVVKER